MNANFEVHPNDAHAHPHDLVGTVPNRLPAAVVRKLSTLDPSRAWAAIAGEWAMIAAAFAVTALWWHPITIAAAVIFIGARQHALTVLAHDASHHRLLPDKAANEWVGDLLLAWPVFITVGGFRRFHKEHHRFVNREGDGNRTLWRTHDAEGALAPEWTYPKTKGALLLKLARRTALLTGLRWVVRGFLAPFILPTPVSYKLIRLAWFGALFGGLSVAGLWPQYLLLWLLPLCTWHVTAQYLRLVFEHSAVRTGDPRFAETRSTLPGLVGRLLVLPRHIGYHIEHHWYPSVPFYNLPDLHAALIQDPEYVQHANITHSIRASFLEVTATEAPAHA